MSLIDRFLRSQATELGRTIASQIDADPEGWTTDGGYYLRNPKHRFELWIANRDYGLKVHPLGRRLAFTPSWADRKLIWRAISRLQLPTPREITQRRVLETVRTPAQ